MSRYINTLQHTALGLLLGLIVAAATQSVLTGWVAQSFFWLGVEAEQHRHRLQAVGELIVWWTWYRLFLLQNWTQDGRRDFLGPVIINGILAAVAYSYLR